MNGLLAMDGRDRCLIKIVLHFRWHGKPEFSCFGQMTLGVLELTLFPIGYGKVVVYLRK